MDADRRHIDPAFPRAAAGGLLLVGLLALLNAFDTLTTAVNMSRWIVVPCAETALGVALIVLTRGVFRARFGAALGAMGVGIVLLFVSGAWFLLDLSVRHGGVYDFWTIVGAFVCVVLCGLALAPCRRAEVARTRR